MAFENLEAFNREVQDFSQRVVPEKFVLFQKKIALEALRRIVLKTPVDTGRARGNWQVTIDINPGEINLSPDLLDPTGAFTINEGSGSINEEVKEIGQVIYITNNLVYILPLEFGHSNQAPAGMVNSTFAELLTMFDSET